MNRLFLTAILLAITFSLSSAQLIVNVGNNMQVETTGGVYISNASDVVENSSGYLKGVVESSSLSGATQFAGLTLSSGFTGTIKRTTGTAYAKGNGEGTNFKRYYEFNNTSGSALVANCDVACVTSGVNDETNTAPAPYFEYNYQSAWNAYGEGSPGSTIHAANVSIPTGASDLVFASGVGVAAKIFLQGPYNASSNNMNTSINADIPLTSPYSEDPRTTTAVPSTAVDWVLVQLLEETSPGTFNVAGSRSAFLKNDGTLMEDDGAGEIGVPAAPGNYYIEIKHRNHLAVMSASAQAGLTWRTTP